MVEVERGGRGGGRRGTGGICCPHVKCIHRQIHVASITCGL